MKAASERLRESYKADLINCLVEQPLSSTETDSQCFAREELYIDLIVLPSVDVDEEWTNSDRETLVKHRFIRKEGTRKAVDQLITPDDDTVFIRGVAGIGKSTLIDMYTFMWAKKDLQSLDFDFAFKFTCREMNEISDEFHSLDELFLHQFPEVFDIINFQDLAEKSDRILVIVDGLDELKGVYLMENSTLQTKQDSFLQVVFDLINNKSKNKFQKHKTFVCGRPKSCEFVKEKLSKACKTKTIEVCGFNDENIRRYIFSFFAKDPTKAEKVFSGINLSSNLRMMASVPVFLWVICNVYSENLLTTELYTNTELYLYTCLIFLRNHLQGSTHHSYTNLFDVVHDKTIIEVVYSLMILSVKTYMQNQVIFTEKDINKLKCPVHLEQTGFIVKYSRGNTKESKYQFRHLILQEFFCALYIFITKNISPFLTNRELSSCLPTIHGIQRIVAEEKNELYTDFFCALEICHAKNSSLVSRFIKSTREINFQNYIKKSEFVNTSIQIPESMYGGNILKIDSLNSDCLQFLDIFKESMGNLTPIRFYEAKLYLHAQKDYRTIINLLNFLNIERIKTVLPITDFSHPISKDLAILCKMATKENEDLITTVTINKRSRSYLWFYYCTVKVESDLEHLESLICNILSLEFINMSKDLYINIQEDLFDSAKQEVCAMVRKAILNKTMVYIKPLRSDGDIIDGIHFSFGKVKMESFLREFEIDSSNEYIKY